MMMDSGVALIAFQIDNGFVVRTMNHHNDIFGSRNPASSTALTTKPLLTTSFRRQ